jgi:hypothetical protein
MISGGLMMVTIVGGGGYVCHAKGDRDDNGDGLF